MLYSWLNCGFPWELKCGFQREMQSRFQFLAVLLAGFTFLVLGTSSFGDEFTLINPEGGEEIIEAELLGSDQDWHALALSDGRCRIVQQAAVKKRVPNAGPTPLTGKQVAAELEKEYGADKFRYEVLDAYVVGLVLSTPLPKTSESRAKNVLKRATKFMKDVENAFSTFLKEAQIASNKPKYPQVMLIFETDLEFEDYTAKITQQRGLQSAMIAGFYSPITNYLAIRLEECSNFETPFHEAIHQQVYNRGLLQRLAPVPQWFDEGIATGFEGNGKIVTQPTKVSPRYARQAIRGTALSWDEMHANDAVFRTGESVSDAYGQAWGLHWLLVTKYKEEYRKYLKLLHDKPAMGEDTPDERQADFSAAFKKPLRELEKEFPDALQIAVKKQKVVLEPIKPVGISRTESNLGIVTMTAVSTNGVLRLEGQLENISPLRPMSYLVRVVVGDGTYSAWFQDKVGMQKKVPLGPQVPLERLAGITGNGASNTYHVEVLSAPSDHPIAAKWREKQGISEYPIRRKGKK